MSAPIDLAALKTRQRAAWASGDYAVIGTTLQIGGEPLAEACDLRTDERLQVSFQQADAEALPFDDASFDAVVSTFGVMFAPDHAKSAAELLRVCRRGGRIGLANWTPEGFVGRAFGALSAGQGAELERDLTELLDRLNRAARSQP